jgi:putative acetyltransferase
MSIVIKEVLSINEIELKKIQQLFEAYQLELDEDLCFQSFSDELANPLIKYGAAVNGALLLAYFNNDMVGCVALKNLGNQVCEMKRLYVQPEFRKHKIGKYLVEAILEKAKDLQYKTIKLDTLSKLQPAIHLYLQFGFVETKSYYHNPLNNVVYMQKEL